MSSDHDRKQELYSLIADNILEIPEGSEPSPDSIVIESIMTEDEIKQFVRDIPNRERITMKTSWRKIIAFNNFVHGLPLTNGQLLPGWLASHPEESKFTCAIKRVTDQVQKINATIQVKFENIDIDNSATGEHGIILRNPDGTIAFTKEGLKARNTARTELLDKEDVEIEPYFATEVPELTADEREMFAGFVIKEEEKLSAVA